MDSKGEVLRAAQGRRLYDGVEMNILELFAGTESFSNVGRERGHTAVTVELDPFFDPTHEMDILDYDPDEMPYDPGAFDVIWASPPCNVYSTGTFHCHYFMKFGDEYIPARPEAAHSWRMVKKSIEIINWYQPRWFIFENPRGLLRKMEFMRDYDRATVTYCQYGDMRMKPTDLMGKLHGLTFRPKCKNGAPCHERAPRGAKTGTQGLKGSKARAVVPRALCEDLIKQLEVLIDERR